VGDAGAHAAAENDWPGQGRDRAVADRHECPRLEPAGRQADVDRCGAHSIVFADRPLRAAGHSLTADLLEEWSPSNDSDDSFAKGPPNATVSVFSKDGSRIRDAVVALRRRSSRATG
jgi:hypothetical protein